MRWPWLLLLAALPLALQPFAPLLEWQADASEEPWRWLTGHLVHGHLQHLCLNLVALVLFAVLLVRPGEELRVFGCALWCAGIVAVGLSWLAPDLVAYRGLSGVLHGVVLAQCLSRRTPAHLMVILLVAAKLAWETLTAGPAALGGMVVVTEAHLLGGLAGVVWAAIGSLANMWRDKDTKPSATGARQW